MLQVSELVKLAKIAASAKPSSPVAYSFNGETFSYDDVQETLRSQFAELAPDYRGYRENKNTIFRIIEETLSETVPAQLKQNYMQFAEVKRFAQGDKPIFRRKTLNNRNRGKQFITRVGLAGVYEVFRLGSAQESFEVPTSAIGGAAQIGFEEYLDGRVDWVELLNIIYEGIDELVFEEVGEALNEGFYQLPAENKYAGAGFIEVAFDKLLNRAKMYGNVTIYCTNEFAVKMIPKEAWRYSDSMKEELYRNGRLLGYKNENVVVLPNSYKNAFGQEKVLDPAMCWIVPSAADQKPVKIAIEGDLYTNEFENYDWSRDIHVYEKIGVVCMMDNAVHVYKDTSLSKTGDFNLADTVHNVIDVNDVTAPKDKFQVADMTSVTNPSTSGLYELVNGEFVASEDTEVDSGKVYFSKITA